MGILDKRGHAINDRRMNLSGTLTFQRILVLAAIGCTLLISINYLATNKSNECNCSESSRQFLNGLSVGNDRHPGALHCPPPPEAIIQPCPPQPEPSCSAQPEAKVPVYLGDYKVMCHAKYLDFWMFFDSRDKGIMPHICGGRSWEMEITNAFEITVKPGWTVLDIGANYGWYTIKLSQLVGNSGRVISLEAQPHTFGLLDLSIEIAGIKNLVSVVNKAAYSRSNEVVKMSFMPDRPLNNALAVEDMDVTKQAKEFVEVNTTTIDDLVAEHKLKSVNFMKIDVEGVEDSVWEGMQETLKNNPEIVVFMEVNAARMRRNNKEPEPFYTKIQSHFPILRHVRGSAGIEEIKIEDMLDQGEDVFLVLYNS